ncbi:putative Ig domain-containing protein [Prosthecobacter sp.]|uniref:putative Ig domain-containing protein n=1 Tax=Prosthecobacter sp. TaxID=1965333 RepID=UPI00378369A5
MPNGESQDPYPNDAWNGQPHFNYNGVEYAGNWADADGDGIPDVVDPIFSGAGYSYWWNGVEYAGPWVDSDWDGTPNDFDPFPDGSYWYNGTEYGGVWNDQDGDGIPDALDSYPNDSWNGSPHYTYQGNEYPGNSTDDRDSDGIPDTADTYPDDPTNHADTDNDGICDYDENTQYGTDPNKQDTDDDGLSDFDELFNHHTNPLLAKTNPTQPYSDFYMVDQADADGDGIPNGVEEWYRDQGYGMDPNDASDANGDLDSDGYTNVQAWRNGWSLIASLNTYDNDNDGILDVLEDAWNAAYPGILSNSNAADATEDFDGDGLMNYEEIALGLNPGSAHSRNAGVTDMQEWLWRLCMGWSTPNVQLTGASWNTGIPPEWQVSTDGDNDGLPDGLLALATALNADATLIVVPARVASGDYDGDGMPDAWEHLYHLDPRDASDAQSNSDGDSLINSLEYAQGRNPLVVDDPPLLIITESVPLGLMGESYSATIELSGVITTPTFSIIAGGLPDGLSLDSSTGVISGTLAQEDGRTFTVQVVDQSGRSAQHDYYISGTPEDTGGGGTGGTGGGGTGGGGGNPPPLGITTTNAQLAMVMGVPFTATITGSGGDGGSYGFNLSVASGQTLPPGLTISDGKTISGTATVTGSCNLSAQVYQGSLSCTKVLQLTVSAPLTFTTDSLLPDSDTDKPYSERLTTTGGYGQPTFTVSDGSLPEGLTLSADGQLAGMPTTAGTYTFTVAAMDASDTDDIGGHFKEKVFTITINAPQPPPLLVSTQSLGSWKVGVPYTGNGVSASGGDGIYTFSGGGAGLVINADGSISGTPGMAGSYMVDVTVTDSSGASQSASLPFEVMVASIPLEISGAYQASGGAGDYHWFIVWDDGSQDQKEDTIDGQHVLIRLLNDTGSNTSLDVPNNESSQEDAQTVTYAGTIYVADADTNTASTQFSVTLKVDKHTSQQANLDAEEVPWKKEVGTKPTTEPDESHRVSTTDGTGTRYRKVGLNGMPLSDGKPQAKDESGEVAEETYVDAYSSELRHGVTDVYVSADGALMPLSVRRDVTDDIWDEGFGQQPHERADRPFGSGWSTNLCATVKVDSSGFHATVTDEQGVSHSFYRVKSDFVDYWRAAKDTGGDVKARSNVLEYFGSDPRLGGTFVYTKLFGTQCVYQYATTRTNGRNATRDLIQYYRLTTVTDRLQNRLVYAYPGAQELVPDSITDPDRAGLAVYITQDLARHVITRVMGPDGTVTNYDYTPQVVGVENPTTVQKLTSVTRAGGGGTAATAVQYDYSIALEDGEGPWHAAVNQITDELGRQYSFALQDNHLVFYVEIHNGVETTFAQGGMPRLVSSVTLPDGGVTTFQTTRDAVIRTHMTEEPFSQTVVNGPVGQTTYRFSLPHVEYSPPPPEDDETNLQDPFRDTTLSFKRLEITTAAGMEAYTFTPTAGMALASATDVSGNTTGFTYAGGFDDPVRETDALGNFKDFTYEPTTRVMSSMTDQTGVVTSYEIQPVTGLKLSETVTGAGGTVERHSTFEYEHPTYKGLMTKSTVDADAGDTAPATVTTYALGSGPTGWLQTTVSTATASGVVSTTTLNNLAGGKVRVTDPRGKVTSFGYDAHHRLTRVTRPDGAHKDLAYDAHGNLVSETNENGVATLHEYDVLNRRVKTTLDLNGNGTADAGYTTATVNGNSVSYDGDIVTTTTYNLRNQVLTQTDPRGKVTTHTYDDAGRLISTDDGGLVTTLEYGANSGGSVFDSSGFKPTKITDPRGTVTLLTYDKMYRTTEQTVDAGGIAAKTCTHYDAAGRPTRVRDALGRVTLTVYDVFGQIQQVTHPDGSSVSTDYTHHGKPWKVVDELGNLTKTEFDAAGRAVKTIAPAIGGVSATTQTAYDAAGNAVSVTDPLGRVTTSTYDDLNRPVLVTAPTVWDAEAGASVQPTTQTTYDALGQVLTVTDPQGHVTSKLYDRAGRSWKVIAPEVDGEAPTTVTKFDAGGLALSLTNPLGQTTTNSYDTHGRLTQTTDAVGIVNTFTYDEAGNRLTVKDGKNQITTFAYDKFNRLTQQVFANGDTWTHSYDKMRKLSQTSPRGITTSYTYDTRDRVTATSAPGLNRTHAYDAGGRLLSVTEADNAAANVSYTYDALGRVLTETSRGVQHSYSYDLSGNRTQASYGTGRSVTTTYDALNRPATIVEGGRTTSYGYDLGGRAIMQQAGNGQTTRNVYDALGRLTTRVLYRTPTMAAGDVLTKFEWTHDLLGNVTSQSETWTGEPNRAGTRSTSMAYDANNRLLSETVTDPTAGVTTTAYGYDPANNRVSKQVTGGTDPGVWSYTYNNANQLTHWEQWDTTGGSMLKSAELAYDSAGNRIGQTVSGSAGGGINPPPAANGTTTYQWDAQDRLSSVTLPNGETHAYEYDYRTRRIGTHKLVGEEQQAQTAIVFAGGLSLAEYDSTTGTLPTAPTVEYTRGPDMGGGVGGMLYSIRGGSTKYSLSNGRGDIVAQADSSATLTWTASYEAYGRRTQETGSNQDKQRANTKDEDPTGLLNEGFRYRDLETGVWLSRDPAGLVDGPNVYAYVKQNPWTAWDPQGLALQDEMNAWAAQFVAEDSIMAGPACVGVASLDAVFNFFSLGAWQKNNDLARQQEHGEITTEEMLLKSAVNSGKAAMQAANRIAALQALTEVVTAPDPESTALDPAPGVDADGNSEPPSSPAKRGPKTDPDAPHNKTIREEADKLEKEGNNIIGGGGREKEKLIPTPGGKKDGRRPDILYETPEGEMKGRNIGKVDSQGQPVKREREALDDLNNAGGVPTDFVPYVTPQTKK